MSRYANPAVTERGAPVHAAGAPPEHTRPDAATAPAMVQDRLTPSSERPRPITPSTAISEPRKRICTATSAIVATPADEESTDPDNASDSSETPSSFEVGSDVAPPGEALD